jgi:hypothetical protein
LRLVKQLALILLVVVIGGLLVLDVWTKNRAEAALALAVDTNVPDTSGVTASIESFPFLGRLVVGGDVPVVTVRAAQTRSGDVRLQDVVITVNDVRVDAGEALNGRLQIVSIGHGTITAHVTQQEVARVSGVPVVLVPGSSRLPVRLPLGQAGLLPCDPDVTVEAGRLALFCEFTEVPPSLLADVNRRRR